MRIAVLSPDRGEAAAEDVFALMRATLGWSGDVVEWERVQNRRLSAEECPPRTTVHVQALQPDRAAGSSAPVRGAARSGLFRVAELGLPGDPKQRCVTGQPGLVSIARELRTSMSTVQALLEDTACPLSARLAASASAAICVTPAALRRPSTCRMDTTRSTECTVPPLASAGLPLVGPYWPVPSAQRRVRGRVPACRPH